MSAVSARPPALSVRAGSTLAPSSRAASENEGGGYVGALIRAWGLSDIDRDLAAVRRSVARAQESSDRCDYADALAAVGVLEMIAASDPDRLSEHTTT
jgi:hypothetical protein